MASAPQARWRSAGTGSWHCRSQANLLAAFWSLPITQGCEPQMLTGLLQTGERV